ncbi:membrane bound O-acyl transferase [Tubulinosema ratisbonensis]|uniref:Membrane bound O-acyl transferase n=1 Tax=Tubulinosema ratisbonensis TaxID=291195 RepID=A0A437APV5_9MICR|nr:membrane bound O-acyl transferase [Tubulinosema ratisbonensis]
MHQPEPRILDLIIYLLTKNNYDLTNVFAIKLVIIFLGSLLIQNFNTQFYFGFVLFLCTYLPVEILLFLSVLTVNLAVIKIIKDTKVKQYSTIFLNLMVILFLSKFDYKLGIKMRELGSIAVEFILLVVKSYYLSKKDGLSYLNILNYIFFIPAMAAGPVMDYDFLQNKIPVNHKILSFRLLKGLIWMILALKSDKYLLNDHLNLKTQKLPLKFFIMYLFALNFRLKFYFTWEFTSLCYLLNGYEVKNYDFCLIEFSISLSETIRNWNIQVYRWLKEAFFNVLCKYSVFLAAIFTFICSAIWHGGKLTDFLTAISFCFAVPVLKNNNLFFDKILNSRLAIGINSVQTVFFISYLSLPFAYDDVKETFFMYKELYFCGHIFIFFSSISQLIYNVSRIFINKYKKKPKGFVEFAENNPFTFLFSDSLQINSQI